MKDILQIAALAWVCLAWVTHVIVSISQSKWLLLIAGAFVFPIGCVHGTGVWFGWF